MTPTLTPRWMLSPVVISLFLLMSLSTVASAQTAKVAGTEPISLHPENPRYFRFRGEPTVLVTSAEHYGLLCNKAFDIESYLDELADHGLNHTRIFAVGYRENPEAFGITNNTLAPLDDQFLCPWMRTDKSHRDGSPIFDLEKWDPSYFERLERILSSASKRKIVVELCLFSPMYQPPIWDINPMNVRNNVNKVGDCGSQEVYTMQHEGLLKTQVTVAERMVEAIAPHDNVYIEICNEPYFGGVSLRLQSHLIDKIVAKQKSVGSEHLISVNVANKTQRLVDPHPSVSIFNFHYCHPPTVIADNDHLRGVIGENETGFRGREDFLYRTEGWDFLVAGGAIYNNLDYSFSIDHPSGTQTDYTSPGGGSRELRQQLGILKKTIERLPLPDVQPQADDFASTEDGLIVSAIGKKSQAYLVYLHVPLPDRMKDRRASEFTGLHPAVTLKLALPPGEYRATQIDTQTGQHSPVGTVKANAQGAEIRLKPFETDAGLLIKAETR